MLKEEIVIICCRYYDKFKCSDCGSEKYKIVYLKLKDKPDNIGVYCEKCDKWFKFLCRNEEICVSPEKVETKNQRPRKKKRGRK